VETLIKKIATSSYLESSVLFYQNIYFSAISYTKIDLIVSDGKNLNHEFLPFGNNFRLARAHAFYLFRIYIFLSFIK